MESSNTNLLHWKAEPDFRGTVTIFTGCLTTLSLCVWSALHNDIQRGRSSTMRRLDKCGWLIIGLLCPELLFIAAFGQLRQAVRLTLEGQNLLPVDGASAPSRMLQQVAWVLRAEVSYTSGKRSLDVEWSQKHGKPLNRKHAWTLAHGFYAVMGGFVLKDPYVPRSSETHYLPPWQGNGVLTSDGVQFLMQHAPSLIPDLPLDDIRDRSKVDGLSKTLLVWQVGWFVASTIHRSVQGLPVSLLEITTISHALCSLLTYALWWRKPKDVEHQIIITGPKADQLGAWMSMASPLSRYFMGGLVPVSHMAEMSYVELRLDGGTGGRRSTFMRRQGVRTTTRTFLNRLKETVKTWYLFDFGGTTAPWFAQTPGPESSDDEKVKQLRWDLASQVHQQYSRLSPAGTQYVIPLASLQTFTLDWRNHEPVMAFAMRLFVVTAVLGSFYGLPHLIGFTVMFPSAIERTLWLTGTALVATLGVLTVIATAVIPFALVLSEALLRFLFKRDIGDPERFVVKRMVFLLEKLTLATHIILYVSGSGYLVAESLRQLFALPPGAYDLPSWGNYWPHIS